MHTGYDNWICQTQEPVLNLQKKDSLNDGISLNSYQAQNGSQTSHLNGFVAPRNTTGLLGDFPASQCFWTSTVCNRAARPYNYQNGAVRTQQNGCCVDWTSLGYRNDVAQSLNYGNQKSQENATSQTPRIRVRDVNSLNNTVQNSATNAAQKSQFDCFNQRTAQQNNTEHANYIPSLFEVNPFQPPHLQRPKKAIKPSTNQDRFNILYHKQKEQLTRCQYDVGNRLVDPYGRPDCLQTLQALLSRINQVDVPRPAQTQQSFQTACDGSSAPPTVSDNNDHNLSSLLRSDYCLGQPSYRNPPSYPGNPQPQAPSPVSQNKSQSLNEPISPPGVENDASQTNQTIRVMAVISVPDLSRNCDAGQLVPCNEDSNTSPVSKDTNETTRFSPTEVPPDVDSENEDSLKVKDEPVFFSEAFNDSKIEIVMQTIKAEDILEQDEENTSDKNSTASNNNDGDTSRKPENCENEPPGKTGNIKIQHLIKPGEIKSETQESTYKSQINREKLDKLIEFLQGKDKPVESERPQKEKKDDSVRKTEKLNKITKVKTAKSSPLRSQTVNQEETLNLEKQPEAVDKSKTKSNHGGENQVPEQEKHSKGNESKQKHKRKSKPENRESERSETPAEKSKMSENNKEKTEVDVPRGGNAEEIQLKEPMCDTNQNEKTNDSSVKVKKEITVYLDAPSTWNAEQPEKDVSETQKDSTGLARANCVRIFPNFNFHFCNSCNLVSPIESFWINAVTGDLKCLNCFKRMNLNSIQTVHNLFNERRDSETSKETPPEVIHSPRNDAEKQRKQTVGKEEKHKRAEDADRKRRRSVDKPEACANKTKSHCPVKKSFSTDESHSPREERPRKSSLDHVARHQEDLFSKSNRKTETDGVRKRSNLKDDHWPRKIRVIEETEEERMDPEKTVKYFERFKKIKETDDAEKRRKSIAKNVGLDATENEKCDKMAKPLKEKQNTKVQGPNKESRRKREEKKKETEKKDPCRKSAGTKTSLQHKDPNKSAKDLSDVMEIFAPRQFEKEGEKCSKFLAKLKKRAKQLSLNLIKEATENPRSTYWKPQ